jgi:hypothetical protein
MLPAWSYATDHIVIDGNTCCQLSALLVDRKIPAFSAPASIVPDGKLMIENILPPDGVSVRSQSSTCVRTTEVTQDNARSRAIAANRFIS